MAEREYQTVAINRTFEYLNTTTEDGYIAMPTGTGKSHVISGIVRKAFQFRPNARIQILNPKIELIEQNLEKIKDSWPSAPIGVYSAGLKTKQNHMPITMAGIMSIHEKADDFKHTDIVLVDECHLISENGDTVYRAYIEKLRKYNPRMRVIGLTATDWRMGHGKLSDPGGLFAHAIIDMTKLHIYNRFFDEGYLSRLIAKPMDTVLDVSGVAMSGGDYNMTQVQAAIDQDKITWRAMQELVHYGHTRRKWLIFAAGVDHADHICDVLNRMGFPTTVVHRGIPAKERRQRIKDYKAGKYRCMVNNNILTTGFDDPSIDLLGIMRPSMSSSLWVQMLGRGTRPLYGPTHMVGNNLFDQYGNNLDTVEGRLASILMGLKQNCLVLDFARNTENLGPINDPVIPKRKSGKAGDPPIKICETARLKKGYTGCGAYNHPSKPTCENCGAPFDFAVKYGSEASNMDIISDGQDAFEWFDIKMVGYSKGIGSTGKAYLRVDYWYTNRKKWTDYVHLEQSGYVLHQAKQWWFARFRYPDWGAPPSVDEALKYCNKQYMKEPVKIRVWTNKQPIPEVVNYEYE